MNHIRSRRLVDEWNDSGEGLLIIRNAPFCPSSIVPPRAAAPYRSGAYFV